MGARSLDVQYLSSFCMELSLCLKAGISLNEGLFMLAQDEMDKDLKAMLEKLYGELDSGESFWTALENAGCFPRYLTEMVEIGMKTGRLEDVLRALSSYYVRQEQISRTIKNAVVYPFILTLMLILVVVILITRVLPIFKDVFDELGATMSPVAMSIMNFGDVLTRYSLIILSVILILILIGVIINGIPSLSVKVAAAFSKMTSNRKISKKIASARFANGMAMTLASGLDTDESLDMVEKITGNPSMLARIEACRKYISEGEIFVDAISKAGIFSSMYCRMLSIGFKTGTADSVMDEIARRSEEEVDESIESLINKVEPTLVIVMSLVVGLILLSVMLPLMSIMTSIG